MAAAVTTAFPDAWIGQYLVEGGLVTATQLALRQPGEHVRLWDAVVHAGLTTDAAIVALISDRFRVPRADVRTADRRLAQLVPASVARKHHLLAIGGTDKVIDVATCDPRNFSAEQDLEWVTGRSVRFQVASPIEIQERLDELYQPENVINRILQGLAPSDSVSVSEEATSEKSRDPALEAPMTKLVDAVISDAVYAEASDIHAEVEGQDVVIRYRVDGMLREVMRLPEAAGASLVRRVKIVAGLDVTNSMTPQDGRSTAKVGGQLVDMRVATAPVARHGEKLVIRILNKGNLKASIPDLDLLPAEETVLRRMLAHREGMVLVTGPTGSGKTTTLYAVLNHLKTGRVNIVTVEDPVEYDVDGISQMQVNEAQGFTFANALRSVLRQDPDIVLVGEIRDLETAATAMQAGLTGHLVFSTLHTNDAPSAVVRLRDMGVEPFKIGSTVRGIVAQRLVRRVCEQCAAPIAVDELPEQSRPPASRTEPASPRRAVGCKACGGTGYKGRMALMEFFPIEGDVPRLIESGAPLSDLVRAARPHGMQTLWDGGLERVWRGSTTYEEVERVLGDVPGYAAEAATGPLATRAAPPPAPRVEKPTDQTTLLLADDDAAMRRLLRTVLEREGYAIIEAKDGLEALEAAGKHAIDLVILDHDMPNLTGLGVLEELRASLATAALPVIMLTARTDDTELEALDLGAQDFLTKPVQPRSLVARVKAVLRRSSMG
jgi:type IV pilus assembly protein PilB